MTKISGEIVKEKVEHVEEPEPQYLISALTEWTKACDLPQTEGESFRQWFNNRRAN